MSVLFYREISDLVGMKFGVHHESPQVLLIRNGKSIYNASHFWISYEDLKKEVEASQIKSEN